MMIHLGNHPDDGLPVYAIRSPFGPYLQCGDASDTHPTPRGCWLPSGWDIGDLSLETALQLLAFPKTLGPHPVTGADVVIHLQQIGATSSVRNCFERT
jgi:DNA topoisomerase I